MLNFQVVETAKTIEFDMGYSCQNCEISIIMPKPQIFNTRQKSTRKRPDSFYETTLFKQKVNRYLTAYDE